jgi:DNA-binding MarR family transcriptional regulator
MPRLFASQTIGICHYLIWGGKTAGQEGRRPALEKTGRCLYFSLDGTPEDAPVKETAREALVLPRPGQCNGTALRRASRRVSQLYDAVLAPSGLRSTQRSILMQVARAGALSMGELADLLVIDRSALGHNLKPLQREGLIKVVRDKRDARSRLVALTPAGKRKLAQSMPLWEQAQRKFETVFGEEKARALREALDAIASRQFADAFGGVR